MRFSPWSAHCFQVPIVFLGSPFLSRQLYPGPWPGVSVCVLTSGQLDGGPPSEKTKGLHTQGLLEDEPGPRLRQPGPEQAVQVEAPGREDAGGTRGTAVDHRWAALGPRATLALVTPLELGGRGGDCSW